MNFYQMHGSEGPKKLQTYGNEVELHDDPRCCPRRQWFRHFFGIPPYSIPPRGKKLNMDPPSRSSARTTSAYAGHVVASGSRGRGKAIAAPEPSDEDNGDDSSDAGASEHGDSRTSQRFRWRSCLMPHVLLRHKESQVR
jgi:hypothetical protein